MKVVKNGGEDQNLDVWTRAGGGACTMLPYAERPNCMHNYRNSQNNPREEIYGNLVGDAECTGVVVSLLWVRATTCARPLRRPDGELHHARP